LNSDEPCTQKPSSNYKDKYNHLIGSTSAKEAARKTEANASFGMGGYSDIVFLAVLLAAYCK